jgi:hypothetical protein
MTKASFLAAAAFACVAVAAYAAQAAERHDSQNPFGSAAISEDAMSKLRGGDSPVQISDQNATSAGNTCVVCVSGGNNVGVSSFESATGIFTVIQNSGNNALLQNTTQVNVSIH